MQNKVTFFCKPEDEKISLSVMVADDYFEVKGEHCIVIYRDDKRAGALMGWS